MQNVKTPCIHGRSARASLLFPLWPVKLVRQGAKHERGDGADNDKDGTGENLVLYPLAVVKVLTRPSVLNPRWIVSILAPYNDSFNTVKWQLWTTLGELTFRRRKFLSMTQPVSSWWCSWRSKSCHRSGCPAPFPAIGRRECSGWAAGGRFVSKLSTWWVGW